MAQKYVAEVTVSDLTDAYNVSLSRDNLGFQANTTQANAAQSASVMVEATQGLVQVDCSVTNSEITIANASGTAITNSSSSNIYTETTKASGSNTPVVTVNVKAALTVADAPYTVTIPVSITEGSETLTYTKQVSVVLQKQGATGSTGYNYFFSASPDAIVRAENGTLSATSIAWSATRAQTGNPSAYSGYVWSHYTTDGSTWTQIAKATSAASSGTVTIPSAQYATVKAIRITLHTASPTDANKVDSVTIPVIDAGATGPQGGAGADAYTVLLTNESHTFAAAADGKAIASSVETKVVAYKGATQMSATIGTVTGTISGKLTATVKSGTNSTVNATLTVAATATLDTRQGVLTVPITVDGKSFTKTFSWSLAPTGQQGIQGEPGDDPYTVSITSDNGTVLRNNSGSTTLTAHVYQAGAELSTMPSGCSIKWYVDGTLAETDTSLPATFTRTAAQVANKVVVQASLEG